jgi:hypothetical protein
MTPLQKLEALAFAVKQGWVSYAEAARMAHVLLSRIL